MVFSNVFKITTVIIFMFSLSSICFADEILTTVEKAVNEYKKGDFMTAASDLDYASQLIRQKRGSTLETYLPEPLNGWTASFPSSQSVSAALLGGGVFAERSYQKGISFVQIKIVTDSPMVQSIMMMLSNPMILTASGAQLSRIKGEQAIVKYDPQTGNGDINIVINNRFLITLSGRMLSQNELLEYADKIDYKKMASLP
ncbi:MAG: hypothetical protein HQL30_01910 [Candidatus Omnitrophica bacterium]|nr:hypothetical protein [Candidatus Omnitrophota bacterium]